MTDLVLGIDGGGTKTLAALLDRDGRIVGTSRAGGTNPLDNPFWVRELHRAIGTFADSPGLVATAAALPAYGEVEATSEAQRDAMAASLPNQPQTVLNDVDAAQIGAFAGDAGILLLAGTGSMAWARNADGHSFRVGGWGDVLGDEGSGYWLGRQVLGLITQSLDGRAPPTALVEAVFTLLGIDPTRPFDGLEGWAAHLPHPRSSIAALAPLAFRLAATGDRGAYGLVADTARQLARHVQAIEQQAGPLPWSHGGGLFGDPLLVELTTAAIGRPPVPPRLPPIGGALLEAARLAGWHTGPAFIDRLAATTALGDFHPHEPQLTTT